MTVPENDLLSSALIAYAGWGTFATPGRHPDAVEVVAASAGRPDEAAALTERCVALVSEAEGSTRTLTTEDYVEIGQYAELDPQLREALSAAHPELSALAIKVLSWEFWYQWK